MPGKRPASSDGPVEFHPIAAMFPLLEGDELQRLAEDIYLHGQRLPAWTYEGKVLDGRNRAASCLMAGVGLKTCEFQGDRGEAVAFAWSMNGPRRHLTPDQLAAIAVAMLPELEKAAKERQRANAPRKGEKGFRPMVGPKSDQPLDENAARSTAQAAAVPIVDRGGPPARRRGPGRRGADRQQLSVFSCQLSGRPRTDNWQLTTAIETPGRRWTRPAAGLP